MTMNDSERKPAGANPDQHDQRRIWVKPEVSRIEIESLTLSRTYPAGGDTLSATS